MKKLFTTVTAIGLAFGLTAAGGNTLLPISIEPANESAIPQGSDITLVYADDITQDWDITTGVKIISLDNPEEIYQPMVSIGWPDPKAMVINFGLEDQGVVGACYKIVIPEHLLFNSANEGNAAQTLYYYVSEEETGPQAPIVTFTSPTGDVQSFNNPFYIFFDCTVESTLTKGVKMQYTDGTTQENYGTTITINDWGTSAVQVDVAGLPQEVVKAGTYTISFPAGSFVTAGTDLGCDAISLTWNVDGTLDNGDTPTDPGDDPLPSGNPTLDPTSYYPNPAEPIADGTTLDMVRLYFSTPVMVDGTREIVIENANDRTGAIACTATYDAMMESYFGPSVRIDISQPITAAGTYVLTIPEATFVDSEDNYNPTIFVTYEITSSGDSGNNISELELVSVVPAEGTSMAGFNENDFITLTVNNPEIVAGYGWSLWNLTETSIEGGYINTFSDAAVSRGENGEFIFTNAALDFPMYEGNTYQFRFTFYDSAYREKTFNVNYIGTAQGQVKLSDVAITAISPTPGMNTLITAADPSITITFSAPVDFVAADSYATTGGQGSGKGTVTAQATDNDKKTWKVTVSQTFVEKNFGGFSFVLGFKDAEGKYVVPTSAQISSNSAISLQFNPDNNSLCLFRLMYNCIEGGVTVDVTPEAGEVESLSTFTFTNPHSESLNALAWADTSSYPVVLVDANGTEVARGAEYAGDPSLGENAYDDPNRSISVTLNNTITEYGDYTLIVPWQAISLGTEFAAQGYKGQTVAYTIKRTTGIDSVITTTQNSDVYNLQGICVLRNATPDAIRTLPAGLYIISGKKVIIR